MADALTVVIFAVVGGAIYLIGYGHGRRHGQMLGRVDAVLDAVRTQRLRSRLTQYVPCICTPAYTERGLEDPACRHHDAMDAVDTLVEDESR
jgi:hypothetical protein